MRLLKFLGLIFAASLSCDAAQMDTFEWLQGCWSGEGLGGKIDECWVKSDDGIYTAVFQLQHDGRQSFSEIVQLTNVGDIVEMRVKHFTPEFVQWKSDKGTHHTFTLQEVSGTRAEFDGLIYEYKDNKLHIEIDLSDDPNKPQISRFTLVKKRID